MPTRRDDLTIWRNGTGRSQRNFADVYSDHVSRVYGYITYRIRDRATAEDLTQATFERALRAWSRFDPDLASERTWLLTIANNLLIDHGRRQRFRAWEPLDEHDEPVSEGPEARFTASPELEMALEELPARDREVIALRFGGDLMASEIAEVTGLTPANVHQILSRSLRKLRSRLEGDQASATEPQSR